MELKNFYGLSPMYFMSMEISHYNQKERPAISFGLDPKIHPSPS